MRSSTYICERCVYWMVALFIRLLFACATKSYFLLSFGSSVLFSKKFWELRVRFSKFSTLITVLCVMICIFLLSAHCSSFCYVRDGTLLLWIVTMLLLIAS